MITTPEVIGIPSINKNEIKVEVNWRPNDPEINECKILKFKFPNGEEILVKKEHFFSLMMIIGNTQEQKKIIPVSISRTRHYKTNIFVKLKQDMKTGEILKVPVNITMPAVSEEVVADIARQKQPIKTEGLSSSKFLVPASVSKVAKTN